MFFLRIILHKVDDRKSVTFNDLGVANPGITGLNPETTGLAIKVKTFGNQ